MRWADRFIAVDWGTTNRRAYPIDSSGACGDEFEDGKGALSVPKGEFPLAAADFRTRLGDLPMLLAGMAGSNRGWVDAPYVAVPGGGRRSREEPGLGQSTAMRSFPAYRTLGEGRADVMRGEEVQLLGAVADGSVPPDALVCHPGTHDKWVVVGRRQDHALPNGDDRRTVQPASNSTASSPICSRARSLPDDAFERGSRARLSRITTCPAELFAIRSALAARQSRTARPARPTPAAC